MYNTLPVKRTPSCLLSNSTQRRTEPTFLFHFIDEKTEVQQEA